MIHDAERPHDCLAVMQRRFAVTGRAGLFVIGRKCTRIRPFPGIAGHGRRYKLP